MKSISELHLKTYILIFFVVLFAPIGNVLLGKGMKVSVGEVNFRSASDVASVAIRAVTSPFIWLGIGFVVYFSYGRHHSVLAKRRAAAHSAAVLAAAAVKKA